MSYWGRIHGEAFRRATSTAQTAVLNVAISASGLLMALWGLSVWGSPDAAFDELVSRSMIALMAITGLVLQYALWIKRVPEEWDAAKRARIEELEREREPRVSFVVNQSCLWLDPNSEAITVSLGIHNPSSSTTLRDVFAEVDRFVEGSGPPNMPKKLLNRDTKDQKFDLPPGKTEFVEVLRVGKDKRRIEYLFLNRDHTDHSRPGRYKIKIKVYGDDMRPVNQFFPLKLDDDGMVHFASASALVD